MIVGVWMAPAKILAHEVQPGVEQVESCSEHVGDRRMRAEPAARVHTVNCKVFEHVQQADAGHGNARAVPPLTVHAVRLIGRRLKVQNVADREHARQESASA